MKAAMVIAGQFRHKEQDNIGDLFRFGNAAQGDIFFDFKKL